MQAPTQILSAENVVARDDRHLGDGEAHDVIDSVFEVRDLPLRAKKFEDVRLGDRNIDAFDVWLLMTLVPFALVIRYGVIAREEAYLERKFGDVYRRYRARVRRWL